MKSPTPKRHFAVHGADDRSLALTLAGWAHRFYVGHRCTAVPQAMLGILSILSGGAPIFLLPLLLWVVLDLVWIGTRDFHDGQGPHCIAGPPTTRHYRSTVRMARVRAADASESSRTIAPHPGRGGRHLGVHRFYVGRVGSGLGMLFTLGGLWYLVVVDIVRSHRPAQGFRRKTGEAGMTQTMSAVLAEDESLLRQFLEEETRKTLARADRRRRG